MLHSEEHLIWKSLMTSYYISTERLKWSIRFSWITIKKKSLKKLKSTFSVTLLNYLNQSQKIWSLLNDLYNSLYSAIKAWFKLQICKQKNHCFQEYYAEFLNIVIKYNNFNNKILKTTFIQDFFNEIWLLMTFKLIKFMTEVYLMNKFYIWIHNWIVSVEYTSFFSSTSDYQQFWNSNNLCFFTFYYPSTTFATTSAIKSVTSLALSTAVVLTVINNHALSTFSSHVQSPLNETKKQCYCDNNLCFYCNESDHWLNNCLQKHTICINEIIF